MPSKRKGLPFPTTCREKIDSAISLKLHTSQQRARYALTSGQASFELGASFRVLTLEVRVHAFTCLKERKSTLHFERPQVISQVVLGLVPSDAAVFPVLFEAVLDELNARLFAPWRAYLPSKPSCTGDPSLVRRHLLRAVLTGAGRHRRRVAELNGIIMASIQARRARRIASGGSAIEPLVLPSAADTAGSAATAAMEESVGSLLVSGAGAGLSVSGTPIFSAGCDMLDVLLDDPSVTDSQVRLGEGWLRDRDRDRASHSPAWAIPTLPCAQALDEVKTQLLAGHETSSMALTWACWLLARHPAAMARAVAEVDSVLGGPGASTHAAGSFEAFKSLEYTGCVLKEAMR